MHLCNICYYLHNVGIVILHRQIKKQNTMKKNMGSADKIIRLIVAAIVAILYFTNIVSGTLGIVLMLFAGIFLLTSFISFCPLYLPFGINTCKK